MEKNSKLFIIIICFFLIFVSIIFGTLSIYSTKIDNMESNLIPKAFIFSGDEINNKVFPIKIAPTEIKEINFYISNTKNGLISSLPIEVGIKIHITDIKELKGAIKHLRITVSNENNEIVNTGSVINGTGDLHIYTTLPQDISTTKIYTIKCEWINSNDDNKYQNCGNNVSINIVANQLIDEKECYTYNLKNNLENDTKHLYSIFKRVYYDCENKPNISNYTSFNVIETTSINNINTNKLIKLLNDFYLESELNYSLIQQLTDAKIFVDKDKNIIGIYVKSFNKEILILESGEIYYNTHYKEIMKSN